MKKGRCGTMTHDYKRNGTTTLFAALNVPSSANACLATGIASSSSASSRPSTNGRGIRAFTCTSRPSGSWLNMVERFFAEITRKRIRRGVFKSVDELKQAIMDYLDNHNGHPKPYVWTKTAAEIFSKVARAKQALKSQH